MRLIAKHAQHIDRIAIALGQCGTVTDAHHLRSAQLAETLIARNMGKILRIFRIGDVDDRRAVVLRLLGQGIDRLWYSAGATMMADIRNVTAALAMDHRLIGAPRLQIVVPDEPHVLRLGRCTDPLRLGQRRHRGNRDHPNACNNQCAASQAEWRTLSHHGNRLPDVCSRQVPRPPPEFAVAARISRYGNAVKPRRAIRPRFRPRAEILTFVTRARP